MNPRELVRRTVRFAKPARVPRQAWVLPWAEEHHPAEVLRLRQEFPDDVVTSPGLYRRPLPVLGDRYQEGCLHRRVGMPLREYPRRSDRDRRGSR